MKKHSVLMFYKGLAVVYGWGQDTDEAIPKTWKFFFLKRGCSCCVVWLWGLDTNQKTLEYRHQKLNVHDSLANIHV
jgi:hypothetical protein